jgi:hypothetical protein
VVVEIIGFFKNDSVLKNHVISIRYNSYDSVVLDTCQQHTVIGPRTSSPP